MNAGNTATAPAVTKAPETNDVDKKDEKADEKIR